MPAPVQKEKDSSSGSVKFKKKSDFKRAKAKQLTEWDGDPA